MDTKLIYIDQHDSLRPVGPQATQSLLDEKKLPALDENRYQLWADYLYSADRSLRLSVAETLFFHQPEHPRALSLFLACVYPIAERYVHRLMTGFGMYGEDLTRQELMFDGAIDNAIDFFRAPQPEGIIFQAVLYYRLKLGALKALSSRDENTGITYHASVDRLGTPAMPRTVEQLCAKEMLEKIAALETDPHHRHIGTFLRALVKLGPDILLRPTRLYDNRSLNRAIDYQEVCDKLGISYNTANRYFVIARKMLRQTFNRDGSLFVKTVARAIQD
jgi:hypothetical protein